MITIIMTELMLLSPSTALRVRVISAPGLLSCLSFSCVFAADGISCVAVDDGLNSVRSYVPLDDIDGDVGNGDRGGATSTLDSAVVGSTE
jgi:hypothetical protein